MFQTIGLFFKTKVQPIINKVYNHPYIYPFVHPVWTVSRNTHKSYTKHKVFRLGAALAYYTIFSLPALLIVIIGLVGFFFGEAAVHGEIYSNLVETIGPEAAKQIENAVLSIGTPDTNWWATVLGVGFLIFVATGVFYALQDGLNHIFEVKEIPGSIKFLEMIINRVLSLGMVLSIGGLLVVSIILNAFLLELSNFITTNEVWLHKVTPQFLIPYMEYLTDYFLVFLNLGLSVFLIALFFSTLYKILPAVRLQWKYIWAGAFFAAILFWFGQLLMGIYLNKINIISAYGAAGSLIVVLIWVYYSAQLIFLGAEFIIALCDYNQVEIPPKKFAVALQNIQRKKKGPRKNMEELTNFGTYTPPSYSQLNPDSYISDFEVKIDETACDLGFPKDKNIDLT